MKAILKKLVYYTDNIIWVVGFLAILSYAHTHCPLAAKVVVFALLAAIGGWYVWRFLLSPFRDALKEDSHATPGTRGPHWTRR
jgi:hypothetical protein